MLGPIPLFDLQSRASVGLVGVLDLKGVGGFVGSGALRAREGMGMHHREWCVVARESKLLLQQCLAHIATKPAPQELTEPHFYYNLQPHISISHNAALPSNQRRRIRSPL